MIPHLHPDSQDVTGRGQGVCVCVWAAATDLPALISSGRKLLACFAFYHRAVSKDVHILVTAGEIHFLPLFYLFLVK